LAGGEWRDERRESQASSLMLAGESALQSGDLDGAVRCFQESALLLRDLAGQHPGEPRHSQNLGVVLYSLGGALTEGGLPDAAVAALDDSEQAYSRLPDDHAMQIPVDVLLSDVRVRRGVAHAARGAGASAVVDVQSGLVVYRVMTGVSELDVARVLALSSDVLAVFADPDMASDAADAAIEIYEANVESINRSGTGNLHCSYLVRAAEVAQAVHAAQGRDETARLAQAVTGSIRVNGVPGPVRVSSLIRARRESGHPPALDATFCAALDAAERSGARRELISDLRANLTQPADDDSPGRFVPLDRLLVPFGRRGFELAPAYAASLADLAQAVLPSDAQSAMRLGLEAHYLLAGASTLGRAAMLARRGEVRPIWMKVLTLCRQCSANAGDLALARDLDSWTDRIRSLT